MSTRKKKTAKGSHKAKKNAFRETVAFEFPALNGGKNLKGIVLRAEPTGDRGIYQEIAVRARRNGKAIGDVLVGLDDKGNLRVLVTADGDGESDHALALFPERGAADMVERL